MEGAPTCRTEDDVENVVRSSQDKRGSNPGLAKPYP